MKNEVGNSESEGLSRQQWVFVFIVLLNLFMIRSFVMPLVIGALFAIVLYPLHCKLLNRNWKGVWSALTITTVFLLLFIVPFAILIFFGTKVGLDVIDNHFQNIPERSSLWINDIVDSFNLQQWLEMVNRWLPITRERILEYVTPAIQKVAQISGSLLQNLLTQIPEFILSTVIIVLTLFYCLVDGKRVIDFFRRYSVFTATQTELLMETISGTCQSVIVASILAGLVQALLVTLLCLLIGQDGVVLISLIAFLLSFFPLFGTAPVSLFLFISQLLAGSTLGVILTLVFWVLISLADNVVRPLVLSGGANLHPLLAFVSAFGALAAVGFYGIFLGPILMGLMMAMIPLIFKSHAVLRGKDAKADGKPSSV